MITMATVRFVPGAMAMVSLPVPSEVRCYLLHFPLGVGEHGSIVGRFLDFIRRPWLREPLLKLCERVGTDGAALAAQHYETDRPVEPGNLFVCQSARDLLRQAKPRHTASLSVPLLHIVIDVHFPIAD